MKLITASLCMLLSLVYGCKSTGDACDPAKRKAELAKIVAGEWNIGCRHSFEVDGPLSIVEVEEKLRTAFQEFLPQREQARLTFLKYHPELDEDYGLIRTYEDSREGKSWQELKAKCRKGDELYFFTSGKKSWAALDGVTGYALIRGRDIVHMTWVLKGEVVWQMPPEKWEQMQREWIERERIKRELDPHYRELGGMGNGWNDGDCLRPGQISR